jgi:hypothetical protein
MMIDVALRDREIADNVAAAGPGTNEMAAI